MQESVNQDNEEIKNKESKHTKTGTNNEILKLQKK